MAKLWLRVNGRGRLLPSFLSITYHIYFKTEVKVGKSTCECGNRRLPCPWSVSARLHITHPKHEAHFLENHPVVFPDADTFSNRKHHRSHLQRPDQSVSSSCNAEILLRNVPKGDSSENFLENVSASHFNALHSLAKVLSSKAGVSDIRILLLDKLIFQHHSGFKLWSVTSESASKI
jgi:hypothetical protein